MSRPPSETILPRQPLERHLLPTEAFRQTGRNRPGRRFQETLPSLTALTCGLFKRSPKWQDIVLNIDDNRGGRISMEIKTLISSGNPNGQKNGNTFRLNFSPLNAIKTAEANGYILHSNFCGLPGCEQACFLPTEVSKDARGAAMHRHYWYVHKIALK